MGEGEGLNPTLRTRQFRPAHPQRPRAEVAQDAFAPNWGAWNGVEMNGDKVASVLDPEFFGLTGASGMKVYRRDAFPRAWAVH